MCYVCGSTFVARFSRSNYAQPVFASTWPRGMLQVKKKPYFLVLFIMCVLKFAKKLNRKCANNFLINKWKQKIKSAGETHLLLRFYFEVRFCREGVESKSEENKQQDLEMNEKHTKQKINYRAPHSIKPPLGREGGLCFTDPLRETSFGSVWNCVLSASVFWFPRMRCFPRNV